MIIYAIVYGSHKEETFKYYHFSPLSIFDYDMPLVSIWNIVKNIIYAIVCGSHKEEAFFGLKLA